MGSCVLILLLCTSFPWRHIKWLHRFAETRCGCYLCWFLFGSTVGETGAYFVSTLLRRVGNNGIEQFRPKHMLPSVNICDV